MQQQPRSTPNDVGTVQRTFEEKKRSAALSIRGRNLMRSASVPRERATIEISELFRRYFVNTIFDSTFVVLGILAATSAEAEPSVDFALGTVFAACLAIGISTGVSVYEAELTEDHIRLRRIERAMLKSLEDTIIPRSLRMSRYATSLVNFLAPLFVAFVTSLPLLMFQARLLTEFSVAAGASSGLGLGIIFVSGYYLGKLSGKKPWKKAVRMTIVALLTFGVLLALEHFL